MIINVHEWLLSVKERLEKKEKEICKKKLFKRLKKKLKHQVEQDENGTIIIKLNRGEYYEDKSTN